jgi:serine/threonine protein kinase
VSHAAVPARWACAPEEDQGKSVTTQLAPGTTIVGRYRIIEELGRGGNGSVHRAHDQRLDTDIALKVLWPQLAGDATFVERFRREAQTLAKLSHPNILRLFELGEDEELHAYFLVLEYLTGGTLKDRLGPSPWGVDESLELLKPVATALDYAHTRTPPVVHRDLKPSNILFNAQGWPVVSDFGVARLMQSEAPGEKSLTGDFVVGTPAYMAPEQVKGTTGPSSDRYALGVIAYELLVGRVPHQAESMLEMLVQVSSTPVPRPRDLNPTIEHAVEDVLLKMLDRDPLRRYPSSEEFVMALEVAGQRGSSDQTVIGSRIRVPSHNAPTLGTPMPRRGPSSVRRRVIGPEPTPLPAQAANQAVAPEMTVMASPAQMGHATQALEPNATQIVAAPQGSPRINTATTIKPAVPPRRAALAAMVAAVALLIVGVGVFALASRNTRDPLQVPLGGTTAGANSTTSSTAGAAAGAMLFSDALDDLASGRLARSSPQPSNFIVGYSSDGYLLQKVNPSFLGIVSVSLPGPAGTFDDAVLAVDAKVIDPTDNRFVALVCRDQATATFSGYRLTVTPASGQVAISRVDGGTSAPLISPVDGSSLLRNQVTNRIELICAGTEISARINGADLASAQDATYQQGGLGIGAGADAGGPPTVEAHFRNLVVTRP